MNILIIEDKPSDARLAELAFRNICDRIDFASSMTEARKILDHPKTTYDFVLVDPGLPNSKGLDSVVTLLPYEMPLIVLTGAGNVEDAKNAIRRGLAGYWTKAQLNHPDFAWGVLVAVLQHNEIASLKKRTEHLEQLAAEYRAVKSELLAVNTPEKHAS